MMRKPFFLALVAVWVAALGALAGGCKEKPADDWVVPYFNFQGKITGMPAEALGYKLKLVGQSNGEPVEIASSNVLTDGSFEMVLSNFTYCHSFGYAPLTPIEDALRQRAGNLELDVRNLTFSDKGANVGLAQLGLVDGEGKPHGVLLGERDSEGVTLHSGEFVFTDRPCDVGGHVSLGGKVDLTFNLKLWRGWNVVYVIPGASPTVTTKAPANSGFHYTEDKQD